MKLFDWVHRILHSHGDNDVVFTEDDEAEESTAYSGGVLVVDNTGNAIAPEGSTAVTGYNGPAPKRGQKIVVKDTGDATATGGGTACSGIDYTDRKGKR